MSEFSGEGKPQTPPMPDIKDTKNLGPWMKQVIKQPPRGYEALTHPDGTPLSVDEQIDAYIQQTVDVIDFMNTRHDQDSNYEPLRENLLKQAQPTDPYFNT